MSNARDAGPVCNACGAKLRTGVRFCTSCGAAVSRPGAPWITTSQPPHPPPPAPPPPPPAGLGDGPLVPPVDTGSNPVAGPDVAPYSPSPYSPSGLYGRTSTGRNSRGVVAAVVIGSLLLLGTLSGAAALFIMRSGDDDTSGPDLAGVPPATGDDEEGGEDADGRTDMACTGDDVSSTLQSVWQDESGAIHAFVALDNECDVGLRLDDPAAAFTLTGDGATVADATFDLSTEPVVVPAHGSAEAELVFRPGTFVDLAAIETLSVGTDDSAGTSSLDVTSSYSGTDAPDADTASGGDEVVGDAAGTPVVPDEPRSDDDARDRLREISEADRPVVEDDVLEFWVPQVSSKRSGTPLPDGSVWDHPSILDNHREWRERFPRVRLLWSGDYSVFSDTDFWVTIVAVPFDTPEGALAWCDAEALPHEDCHAKLISRTAPPGNTTEYR